MKFLFMHSLNNALKILFIKRWIAIIVVFVCVVYVYDELEGLELFKEN